jgi:hypothetical protein
MAADFSDKTFLDKIQGLPASWAPRREQPEWDRDFDGAMDFKAQLSARTDKVGDWFRIAVAFSDVVKGGFEGGGDDGLTLADMGANARAFIL